jgi:uncharacterized FlgJ-related protein
MKIEVRLFVAFLLLGFNIFFVQGQIRARDPFFEAYIEKYKALAIKNQKEYRIPASITIAQGILETDAGRSKLAVEGNNHFGIKCKPEWRGGRMYHDDDAKNECFRTYNSAEDSYLDHSLFLSKRIYYVSLFDLDMYDYTGWAIGLQRCGYATDKAYGSKLIRIIENYELYKLDKARDADRITYINDSYEIKTGPEVKKIKSLTSWRRIIYQTNGVHYVEAQGKDTYVIIAYDTRMKLKRLLRYNDATIDSQLTEGDKVYLQNKRKYADRNNLYHIVQNGESIHSISQLYGMKMKSIYNLNKIKDSYVPKPGDTLKVRK